MSIPITYSLLRYLAAKRSVDDRALNWQVWQHLVAALPRATPQQPLRILEVGAGIGSMVERLVAGDVLIHAWGDFVTGTGVRIEGRGVIPDEPVEISRDALLAGRDVTLEKALAWIDRKGKQ